MPSRFDAQIAEVDAALRAKDEAREKIISYSREIIRRSGSAVLSMHKGDGAGAAASLEAAGVALAAAIEACRGQPEFMYTGPLPQAFQEYAEARILEAMMKDSRIPSPGELGVPAEPYATGLADAAGEMRRVALDSLRKDDFGGAERAMAIMEEAYVGLKSLDYPRAVVPNLKRKVDVIRRLVEETRGDVTLAHQGRLIRESLAGARPEGDRRQGAGGCGV